MKTKFLTVLHTLGLLIFWCQLGVCAHNTIEKSPFDDRRYLNETLANGLKVVVVSDQDAETSGVTLVVKAGSFDNPKAFPGLAHFLEHMVFLGTKKFPIPDEFQNFLQVYGGHHNANTMGEQTNYFFEIQPQGLAQALDRFSDFFIAPLFTRELVARELNAVDSEYHLNQQQDQFALREVEQETSNPLHPFWDFAVGNLHTLAYDQTKLYAALNTFFKEHYQADKMTLAMVGPQPVEELMHLAKTYFSAIPSHHATQKASRPLVFEKAHVGLDIAMKTKAEHRELYLSFPIASDLSKERKLAGLLLGSLIGHEGIGGLPHTLKKQKWINSLAVYYGEAAKEQDFIGLHFSLTPLGLKHIDEITQLTFNAIAAIKRQGVPEYFYDEFKTLNYREFLYMDKSNPADFAYSLANDLQHFDAKHLLTHHYCLPKETISKSQLSTLLGALAPQNLRRMVIHPDEKGEKQSKWYGANYRVEKLSQAKLDLFTKGYEKSQFSFPVKNPYIPKKLVQQPRSIRQNDLPEILPMKKITLWHHQDVQFNKPRADILINFASPLVMSTPENEINSALYINLAVDLLNEHFYPATLAGTEINLSTHSRGITLTVNGYSDKQALLLTEIIEKLKETVVDPALLNLKKDLLIRGYKNFHQMTLMQQAMSEFNISIRQPAWHPDELLFASQNITPKKVDQFIKDFWQNCQVEMLINGNYTREQAIALGKTVEAAFPDLTRTDPIVVSKVVKLPKNSSHYRAIKELDENKVALWYLQHPDADIPTMAKTILLGTYLQVPFFQTLRVDQQLAYALGLQAHLLKKVSGLMMWIQSTKATSGELMKQMRQFVAGRRELIGKLTEKDIAATRHALINQLRQKPLTLEVQTQQWWASIESSKIEFDLEERLAQELEKLPVKDFVAFAKEYLDPLTSEELLVLSAPEEYKAGHKIASLQQFKQEKGYFAEN
ncbi:MAG: insulinase family protein [Candidatus Berkiellales bacterium]